jgi:hypothetical protein
MMKRMLFPALLCLTGLFLLPLQAQNLPDQQYFSEDGRLLITGGRPGTGLYDEAKILEIRLYFDQPNYWQLMTANYQTKTDLPAQMVVEGVSYDSVGVRFKGQTSYFANNSQKKSFNISLDFALPDQRLMGYKTLNLNNSFQDASFMREMVYYHELRKHSPAAKVGYVRLYLNDQDWGLYQNVQQLNKDFLEEWHPSNDGSNWRADRSDGAFGPGTGGWGDGTAALNYLNDSLSKYQTYYTLKSSDQEDDPWEQLNQACKVLNQTPVQQLEAEGAAYFDWDKILWHLAGEVAFADDDSYIYKGKMDYYVYQDAETGRFATYDYDGNSVMKNNAVNWSPFYNETKANYPLMNKVLAIPALRQRYLAHLRTILKESFDEQSTSALIDRYDALIRSSVQADPKKTSTMTQYVNELAALKNFILNRKNYLLSQPEVSAESPTLQDVSLQALAGEWMSPVAGEAPKVNVTCFHPAGIREVWLHYGYDLYGTFQKTAMNDTGQDGDGIAGDGIFSATLPAQPSGTRVRFYVEAVANNTPGTRAYMPEGAEHRVFTYLTVPRMSSDKTVVINEFMASNVEGSGITDESGQYEDWVELYNTSDSTIDLSGYFLTDNASRPTKWIFPEGSSIEPDGYLIVWADEDQEQGPLHANFKISASGEVLQLFDRDTVLLDSVSFGAVQTNLTLSRIPNGTGPFELTTPTFLAFNEASSSSQETNLKENAISFYPNPVADDLFLYSEHRQPVAVRITDTRGNVWAACDLSGSRAISLRHLPAGLYVIQAGNQAKKLLIMR